MISAIGDFIRDGLTNLLVNSYGAPDWVVDLIMYVLAVSVVVVFAMLTMMLLTWLERKIIGRIQDRIGPNRTGPLGLLQPVADMIKLFTKEFIVPTKADKIVYYLAPVIFVIPSFLVFAVMPFDKDAILSDLNIGFLFIVALSSTGTIAMLMAGWASNNKYALLGGMRGVAQFVSYEIPQVLSVVGVLILVGSLKMGDIVRAQEGVWFLFLQPIAFLIFLISSISEINRTPFDLAEPNRRSSPATVPEYGAIGFAVFTRRVHQHVRRVGLRRHDIFRRVAGAADHLAADRHEHPAGLGLVPGQDVRDGVPDDLAARHAAAPARGPADELRVEAARAAGAGQPAAERHRPDDPDPREPEPEQPHGPDRGSRSVP